MMDIGSTIAPKSDQLDAVDLLTGPQTFTITGASKGSSEQPVNLSLAEFPRVWRPGLSMRRVLVACWGPDASTYVGRRVRLYCDPDVKFGGMAVGGVRISHLSHIDKARAIPLIVTRGKSVMFPVKVLTDDLAPQQAGVTDQQLGRIVALFDDLNMTGKDQRLDYCRNLIGRNVGSAKDMTAAEANQVIEALNADVAADESGEASWPTDETQDGAPFEEGE